MFHALKWFLDCIRGATEEQHMKFSWLLSQQEFFLLEKKRQRSWDCQRDFSTFSIAPRNSLPSLCFTGAIPTLWIFLLWFTFPWKDLSLVLLGSEIDFWMPTLILTDWASSSFLYKDPASLERSFQGCEGSQDEPQTQETEGEASDHCLEHSLLVWWHLRGAWWVLANTSTVAWGDQNFSGQLPSSPSFFSPPRWIVPVVYFLLGEWQYTGVWSTGISLVTNESLHSRFHYLLFFIDLDNTSNLGVSLKRDLSSLGLKGIRLMAFNFWTSRCDCQKILWSITTGSAWALAWILNFRTWKFLVVRCSLVDD